MTKGLLLKSIRIKKTIGRLFFKKQLEFVENNFFRNFIICRVINFRGARLGKDGSVV